MSLVIVVIAVIVLLGGGVLVRQIQAKRSSVVPVKESYNAQWKALQIHCGKRKTWPKALQEADALLENVLKNKKYKGKTVGERLVAAQHELTDNEAVWFAHKTSKEIVGTDVRKLKKQDIIDSLQGFRQALKDLGALE